MSTMNPVRKSVLMIILFVFVFVSFALLACDDGPKPPCDNACGITSPVNEVEQGVIDFLAPDHQDTLSGGN